MATMPREVYTEMFMGATLGWVAVTPRAKSSVTITRGRLDWAGDVSPSRLSMVLSDSSGNLNPANPTGTYFGVLNRNPPLRFGFVLLRDTFGRTSVDSWGTTTALVTAGTIRSTRTAAYTLSGTAADFDVAAGVGTQVVTTSNGKRRAYLAGLTAFRNIEVQVDLNLPTPGAGSISAGVMLRGTSTSDYACVEADVTSAGVVRIAIRDHDDNTYLVAATTVSGVVSTKTRLLVQVEGTTLRGKLWNTDGVEPYGWHAEVSAPDLSYTGWVGLRSATASVSGITFTYDNLIIRSPRFFGVAGKLQPKADVSGRDKTVSVEGRGIRGRMERNAGNPASTLTQYLPGTSPLDYWPMTGGNLVEVGQNAVIGRQDLRPFVGTHPSGAVFASPQWGSGSLGPWLEPGVSRSGGGSLTVLWAPVSMPGFTTTWTVDLIYASPTGGDEASAIVDVNPSYLSGGAAGWPQLTISAAGSEVLVSMAALPEESGSATGLFDGLGHHVRWTCTQSGGNVNTIVSVDGNTALSASFAATLTAISTIGLVGSGSGTITFAQGHAGIWTSPPNLADTADAALGYRGEAAGNRIVRLCEDNDIPLSYVGDLDLCVPMGPQHADAVLKNLLECADTDGGLLVESRMTDGFVYITGQALYGLTTGLTLDFSSHQLADEFYPAFDDQAIRNKVTVRRRDGGTYTATQTSGPNNTNNPGDDPDGVGVYDAGSITINPQADTQLPDAANWELHLGTATDPRVPDITVNAANPNVTDLIDDAALSMEVGDKLAVTNLTARDIYDTYNQLVVGYTEVLDQAFQTKIVFTATPEAPYHVGEWDDTSFRWDSADSTLSAGVNTTATSLSVAFTTTRWTTSAAQFPFDINVEGERMTVTNITATTSPQTFTVTRSVNGVVKSHSTNDPVVLFDPSYWGRGN